MEVVTIATARTVEFFAHVAKLNRKAARFGVAPLTVAAVGAPRLEDKTIVTIFEGREKTREVKVTVQDFSVTGEPFALGGWQFVATIEHGPKANVFAKSPAFSGVIPERFRLTDHCLCEHCGQRRARKDTYIVHSAETADFKQVGRTCLKDFLGANSIAAFLFSGVAVESIREFAEDSFGAIGSSDYGVDVVDVVAAAVCAVRLCGWVASKDANETRVSTHMRVSSILFPSPTLPLAERITPTEADKEKAAVLLTWLESVEASGEYISNLKAACVNGVATMRQIPLIVSITAAHARAMGLAAEKENKPKGRHVGTVGQREDFGAVTLLRLRVTEGFYGLTSICTFEDAEGNCLVWFASGEPLSEGDEGKKFTLKGTVKQHGEFKGTPQTTLTRCKVFGV